MKKVRILQTACALASLLMLAACTQEELADGNTLPEGKYPIALTATQNEVVASPQTRVSDYDDNGTHKSTWTAGDRIKVVVSEGGNGMETTCTLGDDGNITAYDPQLYWKTNQPSKINAWYSNITGQSTTISNTVSLSSQADRLAYVLKAEEIADANYKNKNIELKFHHQLAKVRVKLVKGTYTGSLNVTSVSVKGYTSCAVNNGTVTASGTLGDISMKANTYGSATYWEANLVSGVNVLNKVITINADGKTTTCTLDSDVTLTAGNVYTYTITVNKSGPTTYPPGYTIPEITDEGEYIIEGDGSETTNGIVISGSPTVTLKNVNIKSELAINIKSGTPTIIISGENILNSSGTDASGISMTTSDANVIIKGEGVSSILYVGGDQYGAGIGGNYTDYGNITIEDITLYAYGGAGAPGIGCEIPTYEGEVRKCGFIHIKNSTVTASGKYDSFYGDSPAAIGNSSIAGGASLEQGDITIENTSKTKQGILSTLTQLSGSHKIGNGTGGNTNRGTIKIGTIKIIASDGTFTDNGSGYIDN